MNILMALSQLEVTGAEVYATEVGAALEDRGHRVFYVSDTLTRAVNGPVFKLRFNKRSLPRRLWHLMRLFYLIKKHKIQIVHAHSRASAWSCALACRLTGVPLVTTVHGRQPVHRTSRAFAAIGWRAVAVCQAIKEHLVTNLGVLSDRVQVIPNAVRVSAPIARQAKPASTDGRPVITWIGRLSGPKGELCYRLLDEVLDLNAWQVRVVSATPLAPRFERFKEQVQFCGYSEDVRHDMAQSDLVIGAGRVAIEALLCQVPVFAVGEHAEIGLVTEQNLAQAMDNNFGDVGQGDLRIDFNGMRQRFGEALAKASVPAALREQVAKVYGLDKVVDALERLYQDAFVDTRKREMPVLMYHRFVEHAHEQGVHGTWITLKRFEAHLRLLKWLGYRSLTFSDFAKHGTMVRFEPGTRAVMITVDDGYVDNLERMLPLLQKHGFRAVVYVVTGEDHNRWDVEDADRPEIRADLMDEAQLRAICRSGHVELGGHTVSHQKLPELDAQRRRQEIVENQRKLQAITGEPVLSFAYPYGLIDDASKQAVHDAGYQFAVATDSGPLAFHEDLLQIRRIAIFPSTGLWRFWRKIKGDYNYKRVARAKGKTAQ